MKIKISKAQWNFIGKVAGWGGFSDDPEDNWNDMMKKEYAKYVAEIEAKADAEPDESESIWILTLPLMSF